MSATDKIKLKPKDETSNISDTPNNAKCIFKADGTLTTLVKDTGISLQVYDTKTVDPNGVYNDATLTFSKNGRYVSDHRGMVKGLMKADMPIFFACHTSYLKNTLVDVATFYKNGDEVEGKLYAAATSAQWTRINTIEAVKNVTTPEQKARINQIRKEDAGHFEMTINPKLTTAVVPDYEPRAKHASPDVKPDM